MNHIMKLAHEYNEYLLGFVVTDKETGRTINAQFDDDQYGYGTYCTKLAVGCCGDNTAEDWAEEEREEVIDYLNAQKDVQKLQSAVDALTEEHGRVWLPDAGSSTSEDEIFEAAKAIGWEPNDE